MVSSITEWRKTREIFCCKAMEVGELFMSRKQNILWNRVEYRDEC
jgi:hypothetical protein